MISQTPDYTAYEQEVLRLGTEHRNRIRTELPNLVGEQLRERFTQIQQEEKEKLRQAYEQFVLGN